MNKLTLIVISLFLAAHAMAGAKESLEMVKVGNVGNKVDDTGYGSVAYEYKIGKFDVTIEQYTEFLNLKAKLAGPITDSLWDNDMADPKHKEKPGVLITRSGSGTITDPYVYKVDSSSSWGALSGKRPICWVSWFAAARFANWLNNGGDEKASTEIGAYTLNGAMTGIIHKNPGAKWWIPSEDEWYKAAYYDPTLNGGVGGYYNYPTRSNTVPHLGAPSATPNSANFNNFYTTKGNVLTPVGAYTHSASYYGTFDQGGLLWQWTDGVYEVNRIVRGGSFSYGLTPLLKTIRRDYAPGFYKDDDTGFRLACDPHFC